MTGQLLNSHSIAANDRSIQVVLPGTGGDPSSRLALYLVHSFIALKQAKNAGTFAFTSAKSGEGVTHVTHTLGAQLIEQTGEGVLIVQGSTLATLSAVDLEKCSKPFVRLSSGICWISQALACKPNGRASRIDREVWQALRNRFAYVLVDCEALSCSSEVLAIGAAVDATILVVSAGSTQKEGLQQATRILSTAGIQLAGCILNRRTYPVPNLLYKHL